MFTATKEVLMPAFVTGRNTLINRAIVFATEAHGDQVRKGNGHIPYIFHPIDVANEVIYYSGLPAEELEMAATLDLVPQPEQLRENLGRLRRAPRYVKVVKIADRVSNLKAFPAMWDRDRIGRYLDDAILIAEQLGHASETLHARLLMRIVDARHKLSLFSS
jgi:(p)ppGpp synthase/HD superfamily hydrolase